jgi:hypothetical protein
VYSQKSWSPIYSDHPPLSCSYHKVINTTVLEYRPTSKVLTKSCIRHRRRMGPLSDCCSYTQE